MPPTVPSIPPRTQAPSGNESNAMTPIKQKSMILGAQLAEQADAKRKMAERGSATGLELSSERGRLARQGTTSGLLARQGTQRSVLERQRTSSRSMMSLPIESERHHLLAHLPRPGVSAGVSPGGASTNSSASFGSTPAVAGKRALLGTASRSASMGSGMASSAASACAAASSSSSRAVVYGSSAALGATTSAAKAGSSVAFASASAATSATTRAAAATGKASVVAVEVVVDSAAGTCAGLGLASMAASAAAVGATMASAQQEAASKLAAVHRGNAVRRSLSAGDKEALAADIAMDDDDEMEASPGRSASEGGMPSPEPIEGEGEARQRNAATPEGPAPAAASPNRFFERARAEVAEPAPPTDLALGRGPAAPAATAQHSALDRIASMNRRELQKQYVDPSTSQ